MRWAQNLFPNGFWYGGSERPTGWVPWRPFYQCLDHDQRRASGNLNGGTHLTLIFFEYYRIGVLLCKRSSSHWKFWICFWKTNKFWISVSWTLWWIWMIAQGKIRENQSIVISQMVEISYQVITVNFFFYLNPVHMNLRNMNKSIFRRTKLIILSKCFHITKM